MLSDGGEFIEFEGAVVVGDGAFEVLVFFRDLGGGEELKHFRGVGCAIETAEAGFVGGVVFEGGLEGEFGGLAIAVLQGALTGPQIFGHEFFFAGLKVIEGIARFIKGLPGGAK